MTGQSVLVVDDDESIQKLFSLAGKKFNINLVFAHDGTEALHKFSKQRFELVITDLKMPKLNGVEFITKVRSEPKNRSFPFMIMTSNLKDFKPQIALLEKVNVLNVAVFPDQALVGKLLVKLDHGFLHLGRKVFVSRGAIERAHRPRIDRFLDHVRTWRAGVALEQAKLRDIVSEQLRALDNIVHGHAGRRVGAVRLAIHLHHAPRLARGAL